MIIKEFSELLESTGLPITHHSFENPPELPYIIYLTPNTENFAADNKVYSKIQGIYVELYSEKKDSISEELIEAIFDSKDIFYEKSERYIESENMYQVFYELKI